MELFIITGTTKGLGQALATLALSEGHFVLSLSKTKSHSHDNFACIRHDLSKPLGLEKKLITTLQKLDLKKIRAIHLINNAAVINPIGPISEQNILDINVHMQTNLITPIILTSFVIEFFKRITVTKTFTNISSGAANRPISGWALYCTSKSALKMFTDCMNNETTNHAKFKFLDFSPGVMDTNMQATIRKQSPKNFKHVSDFKSLKANNHLLDPLIVATQLRSLLKNPSSIIKTHFDINEFI